MGTPPPSSSKPPPSLIVLDDFAPADVPAEDVQARTQAFYRFDSPATIHLRRCKLITTIAGNSTEHSFDQAEVRIGSLDDNDLVVSDGTVSRHHCKIVQEDSAYLLVDLGSTNGTFVNRVRVREAFLRPGCTIGLGKAEVTFQAADEEVEIVPSEKEKLGHAIGRSMKMRELFSVVEKIAPTGTTVVIEGETGTGKEIIAKEIHRLSARAEGPLMVMDCGAVPPSLIESELFGHDRGAFTGAVAMRQGLFELAHGGTLFLDELGELPLDLQPKLLRALETREVRRVGGSRSIRVDVRIMAATNRDLEREVAAGRFREDLFYRLSVVRLRVPALRERPEDIPPLVRHLLAKLQERLPASRSITGTAAASATRTHRIREVSKAAMQRLVAYRFPGNVRELLNMLERAVSLCDGDVLEERDLPDVVRAGMEPTWREPVHSSTGKAPNRKSALSVVVGVVGVVGVAGKTNPPPVPRAVTETFKDAKERLIMSFEREYLVGLLRKTGGNISQAAREAEIDRKYFRKLMRKYGVLSDATDDDLVDEDEAGEME